MSKTKERTMNELIEKGVSLGDAIRAIQNELVRSQQQREHENIPPLFKTERLTLEASCVITKSLSGSGKATLITLLPGLDFNVDAEIGGEKNMIHKITIEFSAVDGNGTNGKEVLQGSDKTNSGESGLLLQNIKGNYPKQLVMMWPSAEQQQKGDE